MPITTPWATTCPRIPESGGDTIRFGLDGEEVEGVFGGFDEHGFLKLETASGVRSIRSGEIFAW